jgi:hypothetical protein
MLIAFDVKGTLQGVNQAKVRKLLQVLLSQGHEIVIWSSMISYAMDVAQELSLNVEISNKYSAKEAKENNKALVDIAIDDDDTSTWLAAKRLVLVRDIPEEFGSEYVQELLSVEKMDAS